jgi:hypothetical protein
VLQIWYLCGILVSSVRENTMAIECFTPSVEIGRRQFIRRLGLIIASPAIVRVGSLMVLPRKRTIQGIINPFEAVNSIEDYNNMLADLIIYGDDALSASLTGIEYHD